MTLTSDEIENGSIDLATLSDIVNGPATDTVITRLGEPVATVAKAISSLLAFNPRGAWVTATNYAVKDLALSGNFFYLATVAHTSGVFATDLAAGKWVVWSALGSAELSSPVGEVGVIDRSWPRGNVRRYGVSPDGLDLTGLGFTNGSPTVTAPVSTFTAAMVGMVMCSPNLTGNTGATVPTIIAVAGNGSSATLNANAIATQAGAGARVGTCWERDYPARITAIRTNAKLPDVVVRWPTGKYVTSINFDSSDIGSKMVFDRAELSGVGHFIADAAYPVSGAALSGLDLSGTLICWDRFGAIGLQNSELSKLNVILKSDPTKNLWGVVGRGVHMQTQIQGNTFGDFTIEYCGVGTALNTDAAFALDSSDSSGNSFGRVWIKDCAGHGGYILGAGNVFREFRCDGWGSGAHDRAMQESAGLAQSQELCGLWWHRCPDSVIQKCKINQVAGARANALYDIRVTDTANAVTAPPFYALPKIVDLSVSNIKHRGVSIGDRNYPGNFAGLVVGTPQLQPVSGATLDAGYSMIHVNANSLPATLGRNSLHADKLVVRNPSTSINDLLQIRANTTVDIELIDTRQKQGSTGHAGRVFTFNGAGRIGRVTHTQDGGSGSPTTFTVNPDGPCFVGPIIGETFGALIVDITALDLSNAANWRVGPCSFTGYRATAIMVNGASNGTLQLGLVTESSAGVGGIGLRFQNNTNVRVEGGKITGFAKGTSGSAGGNTRCSASNVWVTGNTVNTDLAAGQALVDASSLNFTL
jgi:hypothetical protein